MPTAEPKMIKGPGVIFSKTSILVYICWRLGQMSWLTVLNEPTFLESRGQQVSWDDKGCRGKLINFIRTPDLLLGTACGTPWNWYSTFG